MSERRARLAKELWQAMTEEAVPEETSDSQLAPSVERKRARLKKQDDPSYKPTKEDHTSDDSESSGKYDESDLSESKMREPSKKHTQSQKEQKKALAKKRRRDDDATYKPMGDGESSDEEDDREEGSGRKRRKAQPRQIGISFTPPDTVKRRKTQRARDTNIPATPEPKQALTAETTPAQRKETTSVPAPAAPPAPAPTPVVRKETTERTVPTTEGRRIVDERTILNVHKVARPLSPIPGFADLFVPAFLRRPTRSIAGKSQPNGLDTQRPPLPPGPKTPETPQASPTWSLVLPLDTSKPYATSGSGDTIGESERDWPPYPGTIYCEPCFLHDCLRAIRLRRDTFLILHLLGEGEYLAYFISMIKKTVETKSSKIRPPLTEKPFYEQVPPDIMSLILLKKTVSTWEAEQAEKQTPQETATKLATIKAALERMSLILNLTGSSLHQMTKKFYRSLIKTIKQLGGSKQLSVSTEDIEPHVTKIRQTLYLQLGITMSPTPDQQDNLLWEQNLLQSIGESITRALTRISSSTTSAVTAPTRSPKFSNVLPHLNCTYCLQSGASNKMLALRPYPRDLGEDSARPWKEALQLSFPWIYLNTFKPKPDITPTPNPNPYLTPGSTTRKTVTSLITAPRKTDENKIKIKSAGEFLSSLGNRKNVETVTINGMVFLVLRNQNGGDRKDGHSTGNSSSSDAKHVNENDKFGTRIVLVEMKSVSGEIAWPFSGGS